jgi:hypothetical protein
VNGPVADFQFWQLRRDFTAAGWAIRKHELGVLAGRGGQEERATSAALMRVILSNHAARDAVEAVRRGR